MADESKLMRISELVEATGVSAQTIHYYLREGLLPSPFKTAPNVAYYGPEYIEEITLIKELQQRRYLPLSAIKLVLEAKRHGHDIGQVQDFRLRLEEVFRPLGPEEDMEPVALVELVAITGLGAATLEALDEMGLLMPTVTPQGKRYDGLDVRVAQALKKLLDLGLALSDLSCYGQYVTALRAETRVIKEKLIYSQERGARISGKELKELVDNLKASLGAKVHRRAVLEFHLRQDANERRTE